MKQISSVTTGLVTEARKQIGERHGATGSGERQLTNAQTPSATEIVVPAELNSIASESVMQWIALPYDLMPWEMDNYPKYELEHAADMLTRALGNARHELPSVSQEKIADALGSIAEMLQVTVPSTTGLKLYLHALKDMPEYKFQAACLKLIKTHKWPRLPLPADFIEAAKSERKDVEIFMIKLSMAVQKVSGALRILHKDSK